LFTFSPGVTEADANAVLTFSEVLFDAAVTRLINLAYWGWCFWYGFGGYRCGRAFSTGEEEE
jgi:hypothetical protein